MPDDEDIPPSTPEDVSLAPSHEEQMAMLQARMDAIDARLNECQRLLDDLTGRFSGYAEVNHIHEQAQADTTPEATHWYFRKVGE